MENGWLQSAIWPGLALAAGIISVHIAMSGALVEIIVGAIAGNTVGLPTVPHGFQPKRAAPAKVSADSHQAKTAPG